MEQKNPARHQQTALTRLNTWWKSSAKDNKHGFLAMPTGSGKTFTAVKFAVATILAKRRKPRVLWVAHSAFLLEQAKGEFERQLTEAKLSDKIIVERATGNGRGADAHVILATIQTLAQGNLASCIKRAGHIDLVIFDEFHRLAAQTWRKVPTKFQQKSRTLGLSATPFRKSVKDTKVLRKLLPHRVYSVGYSELIHDKFLADPTVIRVKVKNQKPIKFTLSERAHLKQYKQLNPSMLTKIANQAGRDQLIVKTYKESQTRYKTTIIFCCSVNHAHSLAQTFTKEGVHAESICGSSGDEVNKEKLEAFRQGKFPIATNVYLLTEGVDVPMCRTVFFARPTESPVLLMQMMGRAMRGPKAGGNATCTLVDFVDNLDFHLDLSASHFAFIRDHDERVRALVRRPPHKEDQGVSMALLLRLREFMNEVMMRNEGKVDLGTVIKEKVAGWFDFWDGEVRRVLLVPHEHGKEIIDAMEEASQRAKELAPDDFASGAAEAARAVYDEYALDENNLSEEDFVAMASASQGQQSGRHFYAFHGDNAIQNNKTTAEATSREFDNLEAEITTLDAEPEDYKDVFALARAALRQ